jgi:hypothetical protein
MERKHAEMKREVPPRGLLRHFTAAGLRRRIVSVRFRSVRLRN